MIADQPFVSYKKKKKEIKKSKKEMDDLADRWAARKAQEKSDGIVNPLESFGGSKKTSLEDFFKETKKE